MSGANLTLQLVRLSKDSPAVLHSGSIWSFARLYSEFVKLLRRRERTLVIVVEILCIAEFIMVSELPS
jgi:hypothetical protein